MAVGVTAEQQQRLAPDEHVEGRGRRGVEEIGILGREQLAQLSCLIAIAGDTRSDFDELYDYLLDPNDAAPLEPIIGEGWFLIPTPLLSERPNP